MRPTTTSTWTTLSRSRIGLKAFRESSGAAKDSPGFSERRRDFRESCEEIKNFREFFASLKDFRESSNEEAKKNT